MFPFPRRVRPVRSTTLQHFSNAFHALQGYHQLSMARHLDNARLEPSVCVQGVCVFVGSRTLSAASNLDRIIVFAHPQTTGGGGRRWVVVEQHTPSRM